MSNPPCVHWFANEGRVRTMVFINHQRQRTIVTVNPSLSSASPKTQLTRDAMRRAGYRVILHDHNVQAPSRTDMTNQLVALIVGPVSNASIQPSDPLDAARENLELVKYGTVRFIAGAEDGTKTLVSYAFRGLTPYAQHAVHVHEWGDMTNGCVSAGPHWNPDGSVHGGPDDAKPFRHVGDLGNIVADGNGVARGAFVVDDLPLYGSRGILGRSVVLHQGVDDLGRGCHSDSLTTGHAGSRIGCGVIGHAGH